MSPPTEGKKKLLVTMTKTAFQPVRIYYSIPSRAKVVARLRPLDCMAEESAAMWQWLYQGEAAALPIGAGYDVVPEHRRPIILGRIRLPKNGGMTLEVNSMERAIAGARFLMDKLGADVEALRCRIVNRLFSGDEVTNEDTSKLMRILDNNVTVIDPRAAERTMDRDLKEIVAITRDPEKVAAHLLRRRRERNEDVPMVEDFPLAPEEETPDLKHLANALMFRFIRATEHWRGHTHLTLAEIITRTIQQGHSGQGE